MADGNTGMHPEERDRLTRLETKVDFIISHMSALPPSPDTVEKLKQIHNQLQEHEKFIEGLKAKIAIVGAGFMLLGTSMTLIVKWIIANVNLHWGN